MSESVISLRGLELAFGEKKVLQGIDLEVKKGETLAVIGPSGPGSVCLLRPEEKSLLKDRMYPI